MFEGAIGYLTTKLGGGGALMGKTRIFFGRNCLFVIKSYQVARAAEAWSDQLIVITNSYVLKKREATLPA